MDGWTARRLLWQAPFPQTDERTDRPTKAPPTERMDGPAVIDFSALVDAGIPSALPSASPVRRSRRCQPPAVWPAAAKPKHRQSGPLSSSTLRCRRRRCSDVGGLTDGRALRGGEFVQPRARAPLLPGRFHLPQPPLPPWSAKGDETRMRPAPPSPRRCADSIRSAS